MPSNIKYYENLWCYHPIFHPISQSLVLLTSHAGQKKWVRFNLRRKSFNSKAIWKQFWLNYSESETGNHCLHYPKHIPFPGEACCVHAADEHNNLCNFWFWSHFANNPRVTLFPANICLKIVRELCKLRAYVRVGTRNWNYFIDRSSIDCERSNWKPRRRQICLLASVVKHAFIINYWITRSEDVVSPNIVMRNAYIHSWV